MNYFLIAGEPSGDLHGANLIEGLRRADPDARFHFWGGDRMAAAGGEENLLRHYRTTSFFGLFQVVAHAKTIFAQMAECRRQIEAAAPDVLILIDYPGFNFKMARFAHRRGVPTFYYISPKVWAWKEHRVKWLRQTVDRLFIIFPFEVEYFRRKGIRAIFEGNPLVDVLERECAALPDPAVFRREEGLDERPIVALLAGSRPSEIRYNLPLMVALSHRLPDRQFVVGGVGWIDRALYERELAGSGVRLVTDRTYPLLAAAEAAVVTSGTATLETALLGTPEVVLYRTHPLYVRLRPYVLKVPYVSLVNLILGREAVRELVQSSLKVEEAERSLRAILPDGSDRARMEADFAELGRVVGGTGASERFARRMVAELGKIIESK